jgi:RNA polymerase sigma factor (sigma-70 family)
MSDTRSGTDDSEVQVDSLLRQLSSGDAASAWTKFLHRYSALIMKTAIHFEYQQDRQNECFLFVSEKLFENDFKRLLKYDRSRGASFNTWLITIVHHLCIDWHRKEFGRVSLLPAISALPTFDQLVYRFSFERGMDSHKCLRALRTEFPDVTHQQLSHSISRVHRILTPRQRWQISVRYRRNRHPETRRPENVDQLPSADLNPVSVAENRQELAALQTALAKLPGRQRLLLQLQFHHGLTLAQIAQLTRLGDPARVWRHIQGALKALAAQFQIAESGKFRKK